MQFVPVEKRPTVLSRPRRVEQGRDMDGEAVQVAQSRTFLAATFSETPGPGQSTPVASKRRKRKAERTVRSPPHHAPSVRFGLLKVKTEGGVTFGPASQGLNIMEVVAMTVTPHWMLVHSAPACKCSLTTSEVMVVTLWIFHMELLSFRRQCHTIKSGGKSEGG